MHLAEIARRTAAIDRELAEHRRSHHLLCLEIVEFFRSIDDRLYECTTPVRKVRFSQNAWDLVLDASSVDKTMTRVILTGAIVEALLRLKDCGVDIDPLIADLSKCRSHFLRYHGTAKSPLVDVMERLSQYGHTPQHANPPGGLGSAHKGRKRQPH